MSRCYNEAVCVQLFYHESKSSRTVGPATNVRRRLNPVDDVLFVVELREVKQLVSVVGEVDKCYSRLVGTDLQVVDDVSDELQRHGHAFTLRTARHVHSDHEVYATAALWHNQRHSPCYL